MMRTPHAVTLEHRFVRLTPTVLEDADALQSLVEPEMFAFWPWDILGAGVRANLEFALAEQSAGRWVCFTVRQPDKRAIGRTNYLNIDANHDRLEIGGTWYARSAQGGPINPAAKLLLLTHAFETLGAGRVELRTDARNTHSRRAILKLGAVEEGVLRRHLRIHNGFVRDTVMFSIIAEEWPQVKARLEARLAAFD